MSSLKMEITAEARKWYLNGKLHREDGPAVEYANGEKCWYLNGKRHREDGPAIEYVNGDRKWYLNGNLHREDGTAVEYANGDKYWYLNGKELTEAEVDNYLFVKWATDGVNLFEHDKID